MPNQIIPVVWEKPLRKSAVNTLDKLNEVIDFINTSDIHEFAFIDGDTGREIVSGTSTQLATLDIFGECVQDGTPTPDNPVPVQVVSGKNLLQLADSATGGITFSVANDGLVSATGTATSSGWKTLWSGTLRVGEYYYSSTGSDLFRILKGYTALGVNRAFTVDDPEQVYRIAIGTTADTQYNESAYLQIEAGTQATPYIPYGCIGPQIGNDITPIDLQGNVLAGFSNGTQDLLRVNSAGIKEIEQYSGVVDMGSLTWTKPQDNTFQSFGNNAVPGMKKGASVGVLTSKYKTGAAAQNSAYVQEHAGDGEIWWYTNPSAPAGYNGVFVKDTAYSTIEEFRAAISGVMLYYELAEPQTIELGIIDMPPIPSGSVIKIAASLQPEFAIQWWTESAIPSVINGLKAYVDEQIETVNARIDELHGITRATVVRPDVIAPAIEFEPIEKITVDETETDMEKEN